MGASLWACPRTAPPLRGHSRYGTAVGAAACPIGQAAAPAFLSAIAVCYAAARWVGDVGLNCSFIGRVGLIGPFGAVALLPRACALLVSLAGVSSGLVGRCPRFWLGRGLRGPPPRRPAQSGDPRPALRPPPASFWSGAPPPLQKGAGPCLIGRAAALFGPWESGRARGVGLLPAAPSPFGGPWPQSAARPRGRHLFSSAIAVFGLPAA